MRKLKRKTYITGKPLFYNAALQQRYQIAMQKLIKRMTTETLVSLKELFRDETAHEYFAQQKATAAMGGTVRRNECSEAQLSAVSTMDASISSMTKKLLKKLNDKFSALFKLASIPLATKMVNNATKSSQASLGASIKQLSNGLTLNTGIVPKGMEDVSKSLIQENVALIKSIPSQYFTQIEGAVYRSITAGSSGIAALIPEIQKYKDISLRRAKMIAYDQTRKAYNSINKQRMMAVGIKSFEWLHSASSREPRESHIKIDEHVFTFENLIAEQAALGVPEKDQGIPGWPPGCRCKMNPVIDFGSEDEE